MRLKINIVCCIILLGGSLLSIISCGKHPINGDLDGLWHLRSIETLNDNHIEEVKEKRIYYAIQLHLITLRIVNEKQYIGRFVHANDSLILHSFVVYQREDEAATTEELVPFGLDGVTEYFAIKKLNSKQMILRSKTKELILKKF